MIVKFILIMIFLHQWFDCYKYSDIVDYLWLEAEMSAPMVLVGDSEDVWGKLKEDQRKYIIQLGVNN